MGNLNIWTIYYDPTDFPGKYVVRMLSVNQHGIATSSTARVADSLEEARKLIPPGLIRLDRDPRDVQCIVEVWL
jgi:hypothetical protein